jgi:hypothetical protein
MVLLLKTSRPEIAPIQQGYHGQLQMEVRYSLEQNQREYAILESVQGGIFFHPNE